jgi:mediator of RNA polymerase II transcription subunit 14
VKDHLTTVLNRTNTTDAVPYVLLLLRLTLPLMQAFASLDAHHSNSGSFTKVQIVARDTKVYQIRYLKSNHRFFITGKIRDDQLVWVLKLRESRNNMADKVREKIFNCNGDGWQGLGNGAVASAVSVGKLISELNKCMQDIPAVLEDNKQVLPLVNKKSQNNPLVQQKISTGSGSTVRASQPTVGSRGKKKQQDIITID